MQHISEHVTASLPSKGGESGGDGASSASARKSFLIARIARMPLRYWKTMLVIAVISGACALVNIKISGAQNWKATGTLIFIPQSLSDIQRMGYTPDELQTHLDRLKKNESIYQKLCEAMPLQISPPITLASTFKIEQEGASNTINLELVWGDPDDAPRMVNLLMDVFIDHINDSRQKVLADKISGLTAAMENQNARYREVEKEYNNKLQELQAMDVKEKYATVNDEIKSQTSLLDAERRQRDGLQAAWKRWSGILDSITATNQKPNVEPPELLGDRDYLSKKNALHRQIQDEQGKRVVNQTELKPAQDNLRQIEKLYNQNAVAKSVYEEARAKYDRLQTLMRVSDKNLKDWQEELNTLPVEFVRTKALEQKELIAAADRSISQLDATIVEKKKQAVVMAGKLKLVEPKEKEMAKLEESLSKNRSLLEALRQLKEANPTEFRAELKATKSAQPYGNNHKKLAAIGFGIPFAALCGLLIVWDLVTSSGSGKDVISQLGLPVLAQARIETREDGQLRRKLAPEDVRSLALRLRQFIPDKGAVFLFSSLNESLEVDAVLRDLSRYLAMRDEKVLIIDARIANKQEYGLPTWIERTAPVVVADGAIMEALPESGEEDTGLTGLVQFLVFEGQDPMGFIWPSRVPAVDYMPPGGPHAVSDMLASQPMQDLLDAMKKKYTVILLVGPAAARTVDTEMLASYAHGIAVILNEPLNAFTPATAEFFQSLREANAPLLGTIVCA